MINHGTERREGGRRIAGLPTGQTPLLSIITAAFNCRATIEQTINSVASQTFPNREYIVIDGGSTDGTVDILDRFDSAIDYWISEPDNGIYDALNKGIKLARGEWIYFIGADDTLLDADVFSTVFSKHHDSKFIYGDVIYGNSDKTYGGEFTRRRLIKENICQQGILYHADLFDKLGCFDLKYPLLADWLFNMKAFSLSDTNPTHIDLVFARYALDGASSRIIDEAFARDRLAHIREYLGFSCYLSALYFQLRDLVVANLNKYVVGAP